MGRVKDYKGITTEKLTLSISVCESVAIQALTTDSDLHYCEETQLAATTLMCSTHDTQLFM